jgi:hypothetical protein
MHPVSSDHHFKVHAFTAEPARVHRTHQNPAGPGQSGRLAVCTKLLLNAKLSNSRADKPSAISDGFQPLRIGIIRKIGEVCQIGSRGTVFLTDTA